MKKLVYIFLIAIFIFTASDMVWAVNFWLERVDDSLKGSDINTTEGIVSGVVNLVSYLVGFFYLIALVFGIYAGFLIMTSGWEEDRIKKWKNIFIYVIVGLIVVFLASTIIGFVINAFDGRANGNTAVSEQTGTMGTTGVSTWTSSWNPTSVQILDPNTGQVIGEY